MSKVNRDSEPLDKLNKKRLHESNEQTPKTTRQPRFPPFCLPPTPPSTAVEARFIDWLTPGTFANLKTVNDQPRQLRDRTLS
ncbi:MAG: hypothetical protein HC865_02505 [Cyanobacteria bacterium RU_5_0]|nr:hypothetical protein [Cyanobacteria bacterium RU_5_0]